MEEMLPSRVRERVLRDHRELEQMLQAVEACVSCLDADLPETLSALRSAGRALLGRLDIHMAWEERFLVPALREADAWGEQRAQALLDDHVEQREILRHVLEKVDDPARPATLVATTLTDFARLLREDMESEESAMLDPRVLRDDVVGIDVETG